MIYLRYMNPGTKLTIGFSIAILLLMAGSLAIMGTGAFNSNLDEELTIGISALLN